MILPNQLNQLVQINQKLKQKLGEYEDQKTRFQVVMAQVRLGYENKIAELETVLQKLVLVLQMQQGLQGLQGSGSQIGDSQEIGQSQGIQTSMQQSRGSSIGQSQDQINPLPPQLSSPPPVPNLNSSDFILGSQMNIRTSAINQSQQLDVQHYLQGVPTTTTDQLTQSELMVNLGATNANLNQTQGLQNLPNLHNTKQLLDELNIFKIKLRDAEMEIAVLKEKIFEMSGTASLRRSESMPDTKEIGKLIDEKRRVEEELEKRVVKERAYQNQLKQQIARITTLQSTSQRLLAEKDSELQKLRQQLGTIQTTHKKQLQQLASKVQSNSSIRQYSIDQQLRKVFENRKERIQKGEKKNTYGDLVEALVGEVRKLGAEYEKQ